MANKSEEVNTHPDLSFKLERPSEFHVYRVLHCEDCGNDSNFEIALVDDGTWCIECLACENTAALFSDFVGKLK